MRIPSAVIERILASGIAAPSAENHHHFRFVVRDGGILICADENHRLANAQRQLLDWIAYGAVVENMLITAQACGWEGRPRWFSGNEAICDLTFSPTQAAPSSLADAIPRRCTNRRFYSGPPLSASELSILESELGRIEGVRLLWLDAPERHGPALRLMRLAESERFRVASLHAEMFSSLRFDVGYQASCEQGIPIGATEIEVPARPFFRLMSHWPAMRLLNRFGAYWLVSWRAAWLPARLSPHLGLVVADGDRRTAAIRTGRGFERLWLEASLMELALQPMVAGPLYALEEFEGVSSALRAELRAGWQRLADGSGTPLMAFRLGRAKSPSVRTGRLPSSAYMR